MSRQFSFLDMKSASIAIVVLFLGDLEARKIHDVAVTGLSRYSSVNTTTQQRVANDDVILVGGDTFHVVTTHVDVSQRKRAITGHKLRSSQDNCGTFFLFHCNLTELFGKFCITLWHATV